jgi:hypothetical protein
MNEKLFTRRFVPSILTTNELPIKLAESIHITNRHRQESWHRDNVHRWKDRNLQLVTAPRLGKADQKGNQHLLAARSLKSERFEQVESSRRH